MKRSSSMSSPEFAFPTLLLALFVLLPPAGAQEARARWERLNQIRRDKFDHVLPEVMRENGIDPIHFKNIMNRLDGWYQAKSEEDEGSWGGLKYLSTHPATEERIALINAYRLLDGSTEAAEPSKPE